MSRINLSSTNNDLNNTRFKSNTTNTPVSANSVFGLMNFINKSIRAANQPSNAPSGGTAYNPGATRGTSGAGAGGNAGSSGTASPNYGDLYNQYLGEFEGDINRSYDQLMEMAQGDYDFAAKWIEQNYKNALGSNDAETQQFLKKVASKLEEKSGRVVYDYETGKYFAEKEYGQGTRNVQEAKQIALQRLAEDEKVANEDLTRITNAEKRNLNANLNARGLINDSRDNTDGLGGMFIGEQDDDVQSRFDAIERIRNRGDQDTNMLARIDQENLDFAKERTMENLTTGARRGGIDAIQERDYQKEQAEREKKRAEILAQQKKDSEMANAKLYAEARAKEHI